MGLFCAILQPTGLILRPLVNILTIFFPDFFIQFFLKTLGFKKL